MSFQCEYDNLKNIEDHLDHQSLGYEGARGQIYPLHCTDDKVVPTIQTTHISNSDIMIHDPVLLL
jgi:hypothetical protein